MGRFQFAKHCDAVRRYLLLGQGDFVQALMDLVRTGCACTCLPVHVCLGVGELSIWGVGGKEVCMSLCSKIHMLAGRSKPPLSCFLHHCADFSAYFACHKRLMACPSQCMHIIATAGVDHLHTHWHRLCARQHAQKHERAHTHACACVAAAAARRR